MSSFAVLLLRTNLARKRICKPNSVTAEAAGNHSSGPCVAARLERPTRKRRPLRELERATPNVLLFGLAPRGVYLAATVTSRAGALLPHHFTHHADFGSRILDFGFNLETNVQSKIQNPRSKIGSLFCSLLHLSSPILAARCPDVIRLAALWCSDFPLAFPQATAQSALLRGLISLAKNVEQRNLELIKLNFRSQRYRPPPDPDRAFCRP